MSYARAIFLGLALASGCAGETFDLLPQEATLGGHGGAAGQRGGQGGGGFAGKGGTAGTGSPSPDAGTSGSSSECPSGNCFHYCQKDDDCGFGVCLLEMGYPGRCVQCTEEEDCLSEDQNCDWFTNSCVTACEPTKPYDEPNDDCPGSRPYCSEFRSNICVICLNDEHCERRGTGHDKCAGDNTCVECEVNGDCSNPSPVCQRPAAGAQAFTCRPCRADFECGTGRICLGGSCFLDENDSEP
jgi:hypothetical protein